MDKSLFIDIPKYDKHEFKQERKKYCIFVFVINEGKKFLSQIEKMSHYADQIDIVIADGGSTDGSIDIETMQSSSVHTVLIKRQVGKLGTQIQMALHWAYSKGYEGFILIDGNGKDGLESIPAMIKHLDQGYDHIQGSRFISGGQHKNTPASRYWGIKLVHAPLMSMFSGFHYTDTTNGFRAYSRKLIADPRLSVFRSVFSSYELHYYIARQAPRLGYKCTEIPVRREYPDDGTVPTKISPIKGNLEVIKKLLLVGLGCFDPKK